VIGGTVGWITVTVLVLVPVLGVSVDVGAVEEGVTVTMADGTGLAVVVIVDVDTEVDTDVLVLVALAGLSTPQAMCLSDPVACEPMSAPWSSTIEEPSEPLSWSRLKPSLVATSLPEPSERTNSGGRSPLAGWPVCPGAWKRSPAEAKSAD
jgi:hypothetical protein